jgi:hypothetical protein
MKQGTPGAHTWTTKAMMTQTAPIRICGILTGKRFRGDHLLLDEHGDRLFAMTDEIAGRGAHEVSADQKDIATASVIARSAVGLAFQPVERAQGRLPRLCAPPARHVVPGRNHQSVPGRIKTWRTGSKAN